MSQSSKISAWLTQSRLLLLRFLLSHNQNPPWLLPEDKTWSFSFFSRWQWHLELMQVKIYKRYHWLAKRWWRRIRRISIILVIITIHILRKAALRWRRWHRSWRIAWSSHIRRIRRIGWRTHKSIGALAKSHIWRRRYFSIRRHVMRWNSWWHAWRELIIFAWSSLKQVVLIYEIILVVIRLLVFFFRFLGVLLFIILSLYYLFFFIWVPFRIHSDFIFGILFVFIRYHICYCL